MKYFLSNPELDAQISEIRSKIRLSMNGIVSDKMAMSGMMYKKNYGVAIPRIREIAAMYVPNHDLAERLWLLQIRETMILSTLLEPIDQLTLPMAQLWVSRLDQIEMVEQACMNLFCKLPFAHILCCEWVQSDKLWVQISGFILAARLPGQLNQAEIALVSQKAIELSATTEFQLYKAVALCLSRLCRNGKETATAISNLIESISNTSSRGQQFICNEVKQELLFLDIL